MRRLTTIGVMFALVACWAMLSRAATQEQVELAIAIEAAKLRLAPNPVTPVPAVIPRTILPVEPAAPLITEADLSPDAQPTPMVAVAAVLKALNPQPHEVLVDYGCGFDARYLITACRQYGTLKAIGVEIDPAIAESARRYVEHAGLSDRIEIITGDATKVDVQADIGVAYLWPDVLAKLEPKIEKLDRFVSFAHPLPWVTDVPRDPKADVFVYGKPAEVTATIHLPAQPVVKLVRPSAAVWNGRQYSHPVCNRPGCSMCTAIRAQLAPRYVTTTAPQVQSAPTRSGHYERRRQCTTDWLGRKTCQMVKVWVED